jgi:hypothetical protein
MDCWGSEDLMFSVLMSGFGRVLAENADAGLGDIFQFVEQV